MAKKKLIVVVGTQPETSAHNDEGSKKFDPKVGISIRDWATKELEKRKMREDIIGIIVALYHYDRYVLDSKNGFKLDKKSKFMKISLACVKESLKKISTHLDEAIDKYLESVLEYISTYSICVYFDGGLCNFEDLDKLINHISSKETATSGCNGNCNCHNKTNTLEDVIKDQKPRISLGKDLEERLATYNDEIVKGIISNIRHTLDKVDENPTWWTEDKLNAASTLGMNITDVPEEAICNNEEYKEAYRKLINTVGKIRLNIRKDAEAKKIEGDISLLLEILMNKLELFLPDSISLFGEDGITHKFSDIPKMIQDLKEEVIKNSKELDASKVLVLLDVVPDFIKAYVSVYNDVTKKSVQVSDFVTKIAKCMIE